jgi:alginate O-acetyltransferase complex protein AlgI
VLFNSYPFLFGFLPLVLAGFYLLAKRGQRLAAGWLGAASLLFYGYWDSTYIVLLGASILFNYAVGRGISAALARGDTARRKLLLAGGVTVDLALLGWFKYANFFVANVDGAFGVDLPLLDIVLPVGISFFTFTQIAYLVDAARGLAREYSLIHYTLFVSYFPHLIAGPILHHKEMIPQFRDAATYSVRYDCLARGIAFFAIGLVKKVVLADGVAVYVAPVFAAAGHGDALTFLEAWGGALAYTLQLYFDFSGYSDMAVGLSLLFNVQLPFNFNSPYKARNIIDFWRRWHMTLSRFLRDYLYFALGGNRRGVARRYVNLLLTMFLGGLWHGASWTFALWGLLHGLYLVVNHAWQGLTADVRIASRGGALLARLAAQALTLLAVIVAWVFFRAPSIDSALQLLASMAGLHGITLPEGVGQHVPAALAPALGALGVQFGKVGANFHGLPQLLWIGALFAVCFALPNTQQLVDGVDRQSAAAGRLANWRWAPSPAWAAVLGLAAAWCVLQLGKITEFLYFQF